MPVLVECPQCRSKQSVHNKKCTCVKDLDKAKIKIPYSRDTVNGFCFHDLRHTFNTFARRGGVPRNVRDAITGHSSNDMDSRYDTVENEDLLEGVDKLEAYCQEKAGDVTKLLPGQPASDIPSNFPHRVSALNS